MNPAVLADRIQSVFAVDAREALGRLNLPLMYFRGFYDYLVPYKNVKAILAIKLDMRVVDFKTQHFLLQSKPVLAAQEILSFSKRIS